MKVSDVPFTTKNCQINQFFRVFFFSGKIGIGKSKMYSSGLAVRARYVVERREKQQQQQRQQQQQQNKKPLNKRNPIYFKELDEKEWQLFLNLERRYSTNSRS